MPFDDLEKIKQALKFVADGGSGKEAKLYSKSYLRHECSISIDERKKKIIYPSGIQLGDDTTANFSHPENFVVLECVDRLLRKGYRPEIPVPPIKDQTRIVAELGAREQRIRELKTAISNAGIKKAEILERYLK